MKSAMLQSGR
jgi:hypothetical protein